MWDGRLPARADQRMKVSFGHDGALNEVAAARDCCANRSPELSDISSSNLAEIPINQANLSDTAWAKTQHWRGSQPDMVVGLLIRRSLVRAQVEEPMKSRGYV
jgi:hypothetical protein